MNLEKTLTKIIDFLDQEYFLDTEENYFIPSIWYEFYHLDSNEQEKNKVRKVNRHQYFQTVLKRIKRELDVELRTAVTFEAMYSLHMRSATCWDHNNNGVIDLDYKDVNELGTFMKSIILIPILKDMGISHLHILPIFEVSSIKKKGDLGSPYSIKNLYNLDQTLNDAIFSKILTIDEQFQLFIEVCHFYQIKVILDFAFRTTARDSILIENNPDSLFWIEKKVENEFASPIISFEPAFSKINEEDIEKLYQEKSVQKYLGYFRPPPNKINEELFVKLRAKAKDSTELLYLIEQNFGITTAPAFSDCVNDSQDQWSDISYLKIYATEEKHFLFDSINSKKFVRDEKNEPIWEYLKNAIPYFQEKFLIDGARIDMGHSLPDKLLNSIIMDVREKNGDFIFMNETLSLAEIHDEDKSLYNLFVGNIWFPEQYRLNDDFYRVISELLSSDLRFIAASETSDTPRTWTRYRSLDYELLLIILNSFIPNTIPYFLCGKELLEVQPMNLGLISEEFHRYQLDPEDKMYGKLSFFDPYQLHWESFSYKIMELFKRIKVIKTQFHEVINWKKCKILNKEKYLEIEYSAYLPEDKNLCILFSLSLLDEKILIDEIEYGTVDLVLSNKKSRQHSSQNVKEIYLENEEILVLTKY